jgi:hypothetical protein
MKQVARMKARNAKIRGKFFILDLRSPSLDSALRASLRLSKIRARGATDFVAPVRRREPTLSGFAKTPPHPGDFVASLHPGYILLGFAALNPTYLYLYFEMNAGH